MGRIIAMGGLLVALGSVQASADESVDRGRQVQSIVRTTNSPFCPGKTLDSCPSPRAGEWRRDIRDWVDDGVPEAEIRDRLQARVPDFDLSIAPVKSGWIIPLIAIILSTFWLILVARAFTRPSPPPRQTTPPARRDSLDAQLDEELARLERRYP